MTLPQLRMTEDEFEVWALQSEFRAEFVDGVVEVMSPENLSTDALGNFLRALLIFCVEHGRLGRVHGNQAMVRLRVGLRRVPDILFVAGEHSGRLLKTRVEGAPDLAIEVVSEESKLRDRHTKFEEYQAAGVREYWIVDPMIRQVLLYGLNAEGRYALQPIRDGWYRSQVVPSFRVRGEWLWQDPPPELVAVLRELGII